MIRQEQGHRDLGRFQSFPFHLIDFPVISQEWIRSESGFSGSHFTGPGKATLSSLRSGVMPAPEALLSVSPGHGTLPLIHSGPCPTVAPG